MRKLPIISYSAILAFMLTVSCSKSPIPPNVKVQDLGKIELTTQTPKHVSLGEGKELVITTTLLPDGSIQLKCAFEPKTVDGINYLEITMHSGKHVVANLGGRLVGFTPKLKTQ